MSNISEKKRNDLLKRIDEIRSFVSESENNDRTQGLLKTLSQIELEITSKKYGLLYEEHEEKVDELMKKSAPVFIEKTDLSIGGSKNINFLLEGDNLASLNLLLKTHYRSIDVIYIDPPYNTGNKDFVYDDAFVDKVDTFKHSKWLSFMEKRLSIARKLLSEQGLIFISIDDNEQGILKVLCDSIFGEQNYITMFFRKTKSMTGDDGNGLNIQHEYLLVYAKDKNKASFIGEQKSFDGYSNPDNDPNGIWCAGDPSAKSGGPSTYFPIENPITGQVDYPPEGRYWAFSKETMQKYIESGRIKFKTEIKKKQRGFIFKRYAETMEVKTDPIGTLVFCDNAYMNSVATTETNDLIGAGKFSYPKPMEFIKNIIKYSSKKDSIILDFFAGSGTTGHAVMQLNKEDGGNRKFILCTNNENNICVDVTLKRLKNCIEKFKFDSSIKYLVADFVNKEGRFFYEYSDELLKHVKELVELENFVSFQDMPNVALALSDEELDKLMKTDVAKIEKLYLGNDVLLSEDYINILRENGTEILVVPEYYYKELEVEWYGAS